MAITLQNFYKATITKNWTTTTGDFNVSVKPTVSSGLLVISPNNSTLHEIVRYTATGTNAYGDFVTITNISDRGLGGTTAQSHTIGETIRMNITAEHWQDMQDDIDAIIAGGAPNATASTRGLVYLPVIETSTSATYSLTTTASQRVIVWAKGTSVHVGTSYRTLELKYNGVTKDTVHFQPSGTANMETPFSLQYTETPGAATQNITVTANVGTLSDIVIIVLKI